MKIDNLQIKQNYPLKNLCTMKVGGPARFFIEIKNINGLKKAIEFAKEKNLEVVILSGGSNVVVSDKGFDGLVLNINIKSFEIVEESKNNVLIKIGAGEVLDKVVEQAVKNNWWGIENLSAIPGRIGGFVVQNSGAYGQECSKVLERVEVFDREIGEIKELKNQECGFGYRESIFNNGKKGKYIILSVVLALKHFPPKADQPLAENTETLKHANNLAKLDYPDLRKYFEKRGIKNPRLKEIRKAIIFIRNNKLPDVEKIGSAGSFFKNLILDEEEYKILEKNLRKNFNQQTVNKLEEMKNRFSQKGKIKIPTGWLIDICGFKGFEMNGVRVWEKQALVLVNETCQARAKDVMEVFKKIRQGVYGKTGMEIKMEPELVGFSREEKEKYFEL
ncbi:MAG: UDP-N-acetylmuramate dehydrogenase [Patescibacteria group bacterium]